MRIHVTWEVVGQANRVVSLAQSIQRPILGDAGDCCGLRGSSWVLRGRQGELSDGAPRPAL